MKPHGPPITPEGMLKLKARYDHLLSHERPEIVEVVSWAAGNGDRSENGDYIYGRKRMREIDRELAHLSRRMKILRVIDPDAPIDRSRVFFGASVRIEDEDGNCRRVTIVGDDEQDASKGRIGWSSPMARALRGAEVGDCPKLALPEGTRHCEVMEISYDR